MDAAFPKELAEDTRKFFANDGLRPGGLDVYEDVFDKAGCMYPLQRKRETARMMQIARSINPITVYEIGADKGGGFYHWCKSLLSVRRAIACEFRGTPYDIEFMRAFPEISFLFLPCSSYDQRTVDRVGAWLHGTKIDCLFIDGDKSHFKTDFYCYLQYMNPGGLVFVHDIRDDGPRDAWRHIKQNFKTDEVIDISESLEAADREAAGIASISEHENWLRHWKGASAGFGVVYL